MKKKITLASLIKSAIERRIKVEYDREWENSSIFYKNECGIKTRSKMPSISGIEFNDNMENVAWLVGYVDGLRDGGKILCDVIGEE